MRQSGLREHPEVRWGECASNFMVRQTHGNAEPRENAGKPRHQPASQSPTPAERRTRLEEGDAPPGTKWRQRDRRREPRQPRPCEEATPGESGGGAAYISGRPFGWPAAKKGRRRRTEPGGREVSLSEGTCHCGGKGFRLHLLNCANELFKMVRFAQFVWQMSVLTFTADTSEARAKKKWRKCLFVKLCK